MYIGDNILSLKLVTPNDVMYGIAKKFRKARLDLNLTQTGLSNKSGVSLGSLKRFENKGKISLESLLKLALTLGLLDEFNDLLLEKNINNYNIKLDTLIKMNKKRKRGRLK